MSGFGKSCPNAFTVSKEFKAASIDQVRVAGALGHTQVLTKHGNVLEVWTPGQDSLCIDLKDHGIKGNDFKLEFGAVSVFENRMECHSSIIAVH